MPNLQLERKQVNRFLELYFNTKVHANYQDPPEPDFYFEYNGQLIGIEHTLLIRSKDKNGIDYMAHCKCADKIVQKANDIFYEQEKVCLHVCVDFKCDYGLSKKNPMWICKADIKPLSQFISQFVLNHLAEITNLKHGENIDFESFDWRSGKTIFPVKIESVQITNTSDFETSCWFASQGGIVPRLFESSAFFKRIEAKNEKPKDYKRKYAEIWLLIVEDSSNVVSYFKIEKENVPDISSNFDRTFILRNADDQIIKIFPK